MKSNEKMKIGVFGAGYVGYSLALLLSEKYNVKIFDIDENKINLMNSSKPIFGGKAEIRILNSKKNNLKSCMPNTDSFKNIDFFIIALPTNFDENKKLFDTSIICETISSIREVNKDSLIVIKSTIPIGFTKKMQDKYDEDVIFSPEFLREGSSLEDNLYPSRIVIGSKTKKAAKFGEILKSIAKKDINVIYTNSSEAESIKLFANAYLACRVAFFNELDNFAIENNLSAEEIINAVSLDPRIGSNYNNPSFGYGGYCLPKDTKQLKSNFKNIPSKLFSAIIESNDDRKRYLSEIIRRKYKKIGVYRLAMKKGSDNFRESAVLDIIQHLKKHNTELIIFDDSYNGSSFNEIEVTNNFEYFTKHSEIILANRRDELLKAVDYKVFTRDIFGQD